MVEDIKIEGMGCGHCVTAVRQALDSVGGVEIRNVEIGSARVRIEDEGSRPQLDQAIREAGYEPLSHTAVDGAE